MAFVPQRMGFRGSCSIGSLAVSPTTAPALPGTMAAPCILLDSMLVGRAVLAGFERSQVRGTLWREGLYYSQSGGVMLKGHQIQRQGQSTNELEPSSTWQCSPLGETEEMVAFVESPPHAHFPACPLPSLLLPPNSCSFHGTIYTVWFGLGSVFRRISLSFSFLFS